MLPRPYNLKEDTYPQGHFGQDLDIFIGRLCFRRSPCPPDASSAILPCVPYFEASRRAQIPSLPTESLVLVLWLNQVTRRFCGELPQTPRADFGCEMHPAPAHVHEFVLIFLPPCGPHLIPFGHRVNRAKPTCLSTPRSPCKTKTFCARFSPAPTQIKPQLALAILNQELVHTTLSITHH
jgi:hypothetical protein